LPSLDRSYVFAEGTETSTLRTAPGHYPDTPLPGEGGTVGIAGHRTTHGAPFRPIDKLHRGDRIVLRMPYGRFTYEVQRTRIVKPDETWVKRRAAHERLILSACHPLYSARERIVVFARYAGRDATQRGRLKRTRVP
jgi:sortase A